MNFEFIILQLIYVVIMAAGAITIAVMSRNPRGVPKMDYFIAFIIPVWSGIAYTSMALGQGMIEIDHQITYYARYLDWVITTPLILLSLCLTGMYYVPKNKVIIVGIMTADVVMILSGLIGDLSTGMNRYIWFFIGMTAFLIILWLIWGPIRIIASKQRRDLYQLYLFLATYLSILWIGYPTVWIIGPSGLEIVTQRVDSYLFVILPIFSKVGFGLLDLTGIRRLKSPLGTMK
ncbi:bacteriorhodopsin [Clostridium sp.]|uniref:bacteriorhodopsin n=1 Tax=Clostridium sp. TaxID=1506 RepID=UPI003F4B5E10